MGSRSPDDAKRWSDGDRDRNLSKDHSPPFHRKKIKKSMTLSDVDVADWS